MISLREDGVGFGRVVGSGGLLLFVFGADPAIAFAPFRSTSRSVELVLAAWRGALLHRALRAAAATRRAIYGGNGEMPRGDADDHGEEDWDGVCGRRFG